MLILILLVLWAPLGVTAYTVALAVENERVETQKVIVAASLGLFVLPYLAWYFLKKLYVSYATS